MAIGTYFEHRASIFKLTITQIWKLILKDLTELFNIYFAYPPEYDYFGLWWWCKKSEEKDRKASNNALRTSHKKVIHFWNNAEPLTDMTCVHIWTSYVALLHWADFIFGMWDACLIFMLYIWKKIGMFVFIHYIEKVSLRC